MKSKEKVKNLPRTVIKTGRNEPCLCGSGKKYKKCCLYQEELILETTDENILTTLSSEHENEIIAVEEQSLDELINQFERELINSGLSEKTTKSHVSNVRSFLLHSTGEKTNVQNWESSFVSYFEGLTKSSKVKQCLTSLRKYVIFLREREQIEEERYKKLIATLRSTASLKLETLHE